MSEIYLFEEEALILPGALPLIRTDKFDDLLIDYTDNFQEALKQLANKTYYMMRYYDGTIEILMDYGILRCKVNDDNNALVVVYIVDKDTRKVNLFMRHSAKIKMENGAVLFSKKHSDVSSSSLTSTQAREIFSKNIKRFVDFVKEQSGPQEKVEKQIVEEEELSDEFQLAIDTAEQLVLIEDDLEYIKANTAGSVHYSKIEGVEHENRVNKIPYKFRIIEGGGFELTNGLRVSIKLTSGEAKGGIVREVGKDDEGDYAIILFDQVPSIDLVEPIGEITMEHNQTQKEVRLAVVEQLRNQTSLAKYMNNAFGHNKLLPHRPIDEQEIHDLLDESGLRANPSQFEAIKRGITSQDAMLVLGPPGTGKTTVILAWVKYFVKKGMRVLISSQNNKAVDNVLERLAQEKDIDMIRIGQEEKVQTNVHHLLFENRSNDVHNAILDANEHYNEKIEKLLKEITSYINELDALLDYSNQLDVALKQKLEKEYILEEQYEIPLQLAFTKKSTVEGQVEIVKNNVDSSQTYLSEYATKSKAAQIFQYPKKSWTAIQLKRYSKKLSTLQAELEVALNEYVQRKYEQQTYVDLYFTPVQKQFEEIHQKWKQFKNTVGKLSIEHINDEVYHFDPNIITTEQAAVQTEQLIFSINEIKLQFLALHDILRDWLGLLQEKRNYALTRIVIDGVDVIGATCVGINSQKKFEELEFDVAIVDEAGQIQLHNVLVPLSRAKKMIMLGDYQQIPPTVDEEVLARAESIGIETEFIKNSYFQMLYNQFPDTHKILLDTQYRMPSEIADLLSEAFYDGKYKSFDGKKNLPSILQPTFEKPFVLIDTQFAPKHFNVKDYENGGYNNPHEAEVIVRLFENIIEGIENGQYENLSIDDIGVITPYKSQVRFIKRSLKNQFPQYKEKIDDIVASLDSFQGQERKIIFYSFVRSNTIPPSNKRIGFLQELRRLNVALSRCQQQLFAIGDYKFLSECEFEAEADFSQFIKAMIACKDNGRAQYLLSHELESYMRGRSE